MSNSSNFPGSGQRLNGGRTMTQQMSPTPSAASVQSNTDSGGKGNRRFATLDDLKPNLSDGREAPSPMANANDNPSQVADQSTDNDNKGGDNVEIAKQYGSLTLGDNHQIGRSIFDFGGGAEDQQADEADEAEGAEIFESTDQATNDAPNNNKTSQRNIKVRTLFGGTHVGNNHRKAGDIYKFPTK